MSPRPSDVSCVHRVLTNTTNQKNLHTQNNSNKLGPAAAVLLVGPHAIEVVVVMVVVVSTSSSTSSSDIIRFYMTVLDTSSISAGSNRGVHVGL